ncbi:hypothetical protein A0J57_22960 [Sphingobium sp. 22B]|uniref:hypothetical protein n=1 Tax=Sphingomonadales TaxID=204457 RepID=UPI000784D25F|nr:MULTISPECIES: hypothetical protein [Sphingomonadaceae]KXU29872.1 hypothetical protein AXW74_20775 [Sphingobium sp. AM]KYC29995.1 hypothetical protein A0J57_22960 [Sphingobium sp. 22B]OAP29602.1 hypothetical protein A8O16_22750 [Sphingobium sp. 20006FA]
MSARSALTSRRYELQAPTCDHRHLAGFGNDGAGRSIAHSILDHRQQHLVVTRLDVDDLICSQTRLLDARSIEVAAAAHPQNRSPSRMSFACCDPRNEERGCRVVDKRAAAGGDFMECPGAKALPCKPPIERFNAEWQAAMRNQRRRK